MKIRSIAIAVVAVSLTAGALAGEAARHPTPPQPTPRAQTLLQEIAAGTREILRVVTPEISLPALELKLPTLDARGR